MRYKDWCDSIDGCRSWGEQNPVAQPVLGGFDSVAIPAGYFGGGLFPSMAIPNALPEGLMLEAMALQSSPQSLISVLGGGFGTAMAPTGYFEGGNYE